jgi:UPF0176 protein
MSHDARMSITVCAFYKFVEINDCDALRGDILARCKAAGIKGTILLAREGVNATISGEPSAIAEFLRTLHADPRFADMPVKEARAPAQPFQRLKVKIKREIIAFDPSASEPLGRVGTRIAPADWNALISQPGVTVLDTRNAYEVAIGTFERAIDPKTAAFGDFPAFVRQNLDPKRNPKVAMFCTGGIRCEKASAHLIAMGFEEVYQLDGGILNYLETVPSGKSLWRGECFVFDERVSVTHGNMPGTHRMCSTCGFPVPASDIEHEGGAVSSCPNCGSTAV